MLIFKVFLRTIWRQNAIRNINVQYMYLHTYRIWQFATAEGLELSTLFVRLVVVCFVACSTVCNVLLDHYRKMCCKFLSKFSYSSLNGINIFFSVNLFKFPRCVLRQLFQNMIEEVQMVSNLLRLFC